MSNLIPLIIFVKNRTIAHIKKIAATINAIVIPIPECALSNNAGIIIKLNNPIATNSQVKIWLNKAFLEWVEPGGFAIIHTTSGNNTGAKNTLR